MKQSIILIVFLANLSFMSMAKASPVGVYAVGFTEFNGVPLPTPIPSTIVLQLDRLSVFSPPAPDTSNNSAYGTWKLIDINQTHYVVEVWFKAVVSDAQSNVFQNCTGGCSELGLAKMLISRSDNTVVVNWVGMAIDAADENIIDYPFANSSGLWGRFVLEGKKLTGHDVKNIYIDNNIPMP